MKKNYPISEGWLHLKINLYYRRTLTQEECLGFLGLTAETAEIAKFKHGKTVVNIIARRKREEQQ